VIPDNYAGVFDGRVGFGRSPALLVVDFMRGYVDPGEPLYAPAVVEAVERTRPLLEAARRREIPVIFTRVEYAPGTGGVFVRKVPVLRTLLPGSRAVELVLEPRAGELVIVKEYPSAFFGTTLAATLTARGVDTVVLAGCSTSGCVRATAVDAMSHGFRVIVPRECVGDRAPGPHEANLVDIHSKSGDVVPVAEVLGYLQ
jgi:maleamate amidohydrolase